MKNRPSVSIVSTTRANGLEPYVYLWRLFAELPKATNVEDSEAPLRFCMAEFLHIKTPELLGV